MSEFTVSKPKGLRASRVSEASVSDFIDSDDCPEVAVNPSGKGMVKIDCPYCGKKHTHGALEQGESRSFRLSHCGYPAPSLVGRGYWLTQKEAS